MNIARRRKLAGVSSSRCHSGDGGDRIGAAIAPASGLRRSIRMPAGSIAGPAMRGAAMMRRKFIFISSLRFCAAARRNVARGECQVCAHRSRGDGVHKRRFYFALVRPGGARPKSVLIGDVATSARRCRQRGRCQAWRRRCQAGLAGVPSYHAVCGSSLSAIQPPMNGMMQSAMPT